MRLRIVISALAVLAAGPAHADAEWQLKLAKQMASEHNCKTDYLSHVVERQIGDKFLISAKVHCEDKRAFDAEWDEKAQHFKTHQCNESNSC